MRHLALLGKLMILGLSLESLLCIRPLSAEEFYDGQIDDPQRFDYQEVGTSSLEGLPAYDASPQDGSEPSSEHVVSPQNQQTLKHDTAPFSSGGGGLDRRVFEMETQMRDLRGEIEDLRHQVKAMTVKEKQFSAPSSSSSFGETQGRSDKLDSQDPSQRATSVDASLPNGGEGVLQRYEEAQNHLAQEAYPEAERLLKKIIQDYPNHPLSINARYWLGETYYQQKEYSRAAVAFGEAYKSYQALEKSGSDSSDAHAQARKMGFAKAPEALAKLAACFKEMGKKQQACITLQQLKKEFPRIPQNIRALVVKLEGDLQGCKKSSGE